jgi:hypothetical protein
VTLAAPLVGLQVLYLGISGVLHPSESTYELVCRRSPWDDGHKPYESVAALANALQTWPAVRIVLTYTVPWKYSLGFTLERLGDRLSARVSGSTFEDLTTQACRTMRRRDGSTCLARVSADDYWRMRKSDIVGVHVAWQEPKAWAVLDDEDILWHHDVRRNRVFLADGCLGLRDASTIDRMHTVFLANVGAPNAQR